MVEKFKSRAERTAAKYELAQSLGVSVNTINRRKMVENDLESVENRAKAAENARKHKELCKKLARMVINREIRAKEACAQADLSPRQFHRWIQKVKEEDGI